jgi:polysaccharide export outer membrane protein
MSLCFNRHRMARALLLGFVVVLIALPWGAASFSQVLQPRKTDEGPLYVIQPSDILEISVWKEKDVSREKVIVRPDGRIAIPGAQDIQAAGLNPGQLKEKLEEKLKDIVDIPLVTVIVTAIQSYRVYVSGKVERNGPIVSDTPLNILQALAIAGRFQDLAKKNEILIVRGSGENSRTFVFNYDEAVSGTNNSQNMLLQSGDVIVVR